MVTEVTLEDFKKDVIRKEMTLEDLRQAKEGKRVSMPCIDCEGFEAHEKSGDTWICTNCGYKEFTTPKGECE